MVPGFIFCEQSFENRAKLGETLKLHTDSERKVRKFDINCKIAHGCRRKVRKFDINCKIARPFRAFGQIA